MNYDNDGLYVINIDGDGYNNCCTNFKLVTKSEKQKRAIERDRVAPYLETADRSLWPKTYGGYSRQKPIIQYDQAGNLIKGLSASAKRLVQPGSIKKPSSMLPKCLFAMEWL